MSTQTEGPNHDLFVRVLAQIERHPETWNQGDWRTETSCGTAYCFAGHACNLSGISWVSPSSYVRPACGVKASDRWRGEPVAEVEDVASALLGIAYAGHLFHAYNTLADLYRISADILGIDEQVLRDKVTAEVQA